jgi:hypothetical protein
MRSDPEESLPVGGDSEMVTTQANGSLAASQTPDVRDEQRAPEALAPARQPVSPPTFGTRGSGAPATPPGSKRKARRRGGAR